MNSWLGELNTAIPGLEWLDITDRASGAITVRDGPSYTKVYGAEIKTKNFIVFRLGPRSPPS